MKEITYQRDIQGTFMKLPVLAEKSEGYQCRMILENTIKGCLPICRQQEQNLLYYRCNISSLVSLTEYLSHNPPTEGLIKQLVFRLYQVVVEISEYLLQEEYLLLTPDTIFVRCREETRQVEDVVFCLYPEGGRDMKEDLRGVLKYLMSQNDGKEEGSGPLCYELYGLLQKDNFCLKEWMQVLERWAVPVVEETEAKKGAKQLFASRRNSGIMKRAAK